MRKSWLVVAMMVAAPLLSAMNLGAAAAAGNRVALPAPSCAASASCKYRLVQGNGVNMPLLTVNNGPTNSDIAQIDYDIYQPLAADGETALSPQPAVMYFNGFGGGKDDSSGVAIAKYLTSHGYVVLTFSSEGFGNSKGKIELDSPEFDVKNAEALVSELAKKSYVARKANGDPIVGTTGGSYGGAIQMLTAEFDPRIDAITPFRTWNTLEYSLVPNNLQSTPGFLPQDLPCCGIPKFEWTSLFFASGLSQPLSGHGDGVQGTFLDPANHTCPGYDPRLCPIYVQSAASGSGSAAKAILDNSSPASYFSPGAHSLDPNQVSHGLNVPTLLGQGEADTLFNVNESVASYLAIKARGVPAKMIWHSNGHGYDDQAGEGDVFGNDQTSPGSKYLPQRILAWFDRYLRLDTAVDTGPEFAYFRDWVSYPRGGSAAPAYGASSSWPAEGTATFLLSGSSDLVSPGSPVGAGSVVLQSPAKGLPGAYTETSNFQCPTCTLPTGQASPFTSLQPTNIPGQFADFTSPPFLRDVVSVGVPTAHIHVSNVTNPDVILFGKVWDVDGAGSATLIKRLVAPVRVFDVSRAVDFNLVGFAHLFAKGHRVRFEVAATDLTSTSDHLLPDSVTLTQSAQPAGTSMLAADASTFSLPVDSAGADETVNSGDGRQGTGAHVATPNTSRGGSLGGAAALLAAAALVLARAWRRRPV